MGAAPLALLARPPSPAANTSAPAPPPEPAHQSAAGPAISPDPPPDAPGALSAQQARLLEAQHHTRNDFQLVLSLLMLQKRRTTDPAARRSLARLMDRVAAIGMAHDQPAGDDAPGLPPGLVELSGYLQALCASLGQHRPGIVLATDLAPRVALPHDRAVPLGLIVDELVADAFEHAFPGQRPGTVTVSLHATAAGEGVLRVQDDGASLGQSCPDGLGAELVRRLVRQCGARMHHETLDQGTAITIRFPLES